MLLIISWPQTDVDVADFVWQGREFPHKDVAQTTVRTSNKNDSRQDGI